MDGRNGAFQQVRVRVKVTGEENLTGGGKHVIDPSRIGSKWEGVIIMRNYQGTPEKTLLLKY
jgi:hypothetical protein